MSRKLNISGFKKMNDMFSVNNNCSGKKNHAKYNKYGNNSYNSVLFSDTIIAIIANIIQLISEIISAVLAFQTGNSFEAEEIAESFTDKSGSYESIYGYLLLRL